MNRSKAPKNLQPRQPYFYIMRNKEVFGLPQDNGKGAQFIYEDCDRLINSAKITGNIADQDILDLMKTTEGFRKLVHSIGVSIVTRNPEERVKFVFQMYGKKDRCHGGTNIICPLQGDGTEAIVRLDEIEWSKDDDEPGQIQIEFNKPGMLGGVNVRFFLNDGYKIPEPIEDTEIDFSSGYYDEMIAGSLMSLGNTARIEKAIRKAACGEDVTLAFIGGSVTQGAGAVPIHTECYAYKTYQAFIERFSTGSNVHFIKAGAGGTPSELGVVRYDRDVIRGADASPDVVIVEFAVNDEDDETKGDCFESLVRRILKHPDNPAVILLFSVFADDWNLQDRLSQIGAHYELPMVSIKNAVTPQFWLKKGHGCILSKNQFFYDMFHPSNIGHRIISDCLITLLECIRTNISEGRNMEDTTQRLLDKGPLIGSTYEDIKLLDRSTGTDAAQIICGPFDGQDRQLQCVEMDTDITGTMLFPDNWMYQGRKDTALPYFEMKIKCRVLMMIYKDSGEPDVGTADVYVDGRKIMTADPHIKGWIHCNPAILFAEEEVKEHIVKICPTFGEEDKSFTILGFGYVDNK